MARGINKVILVGNLGRDPEIRYAPNGLAVANVSLATSETWKDKQTGENQERTEWHRVVFYQRLAEIVGEYLRKGSKIYVEGKLQTRKWVDKNTGADRYSTGIIADTMQMLDGKGSNTAEPPAYEKSNQNFDRQNQSAPEMAPALAGNFDDDIPF